MLRTTITKNRKVYSLAYIPRILGGDIHNAPGKLHNLLVNSQRILEKSTNSGSNKHDDICERCRQLIDLSFGLDNDTSKTSNRSLQKPETIDTLSPVQEKYQQHIIQSFIPKEQDGSQCRHSKKVRDFNKEVNQNNNNEGSERMTTLEKTANDSSMDNIEIQSFTSEDNLAQNIKQCDKPIKNKNPNIEDYQETSNVLRDTVKERYSNFAQNQSEDSETEIRQDYRKCSHYPVLRDYTNNNDNCQSYKDGNVTAGSLGYNSVRMTTAKQNEEKLTQKLERIDETPIVAAPKTNIDGFNIDPKLLGENNIKTQLRSHNNYNTYKSQEYNNSSNLDDSDKSCSNAPRNKIDYMLIKEMRKLGLPQTGHKVTDTSLMEDVDVLKKPNNPLDKTDIDLNIRQYYKDPAERNNLKNNDPTYMSQCFQQTSFNDQDYRNKENRNVRSMDGTEIQSLTTKEKQWKKIEVGEKFMGNRKPNIEDFYEAPNVLRDTVKERCNTNFVQNESDDSKTEIRQDYRKYWDYPVLKDYLENNDNCQSYKEDNVTSVPSENNGVTIAKQNKEKLAQNLERIDEAPIVEAPKSYGKGFNYHTETQNYSHNNYTTHLSKEYDKSLKLDDLAERCLNAPHNEIDYRLLKEMEKLHPKQIQPQIGHQITNTPLLKDELFQVDGLKKPKEDEEKTDIDLELAQNNQDSQKYDDFQKLYPTYMYGCRNELSEKKEEDQSTLISNKPHLNQLQKVYSKNTSEDTKTVFKSAKIELEQQGELSKPIFNQNTVLIDPYGKKINENDCDDYSYSAVPPQLNNAVIQALPIVPCSPVEQKKELDTVPVPCTPFVSHPPNADRQELSNMPQNPSTYIYIKKNILEDSIKFDATKESSTYQRTISDVPEHKQHDNALNANTDQEQIVNNCIPNSEQAPPANAETSPLLVPKRMPIEPMLNYYSPNPSPKEEQSEYNTQVDNPQTISGDQVSHSFEQQDQSANPLIDNETLKEPVDENFNTNLKASIPITNPDQDESLSQLLKRVRERNRIEYCKSYSLYSEVPKINPVIGKCGDKKPPCPPPAPICPQCPPPPPPPCPPPPPRCPKPCKPQCPAPCPPPKKKNPCDKFRRTSFGSNIKGFLTLISTQRPSQISRAAMLFKCILPTDRKANCSGNAKLSDDVVGSLQSVSKILISIQHQSGIKALGSEIELGVWNGMSYARDFEPWTPIPSWPMEKKEEKKPFICPKEGCKQIPAPPRDPPCNEKPCTTFPKQIFSSIDSCSSKEEKKFYDVHFKRYFSDKQRK